ncbi:MAG: NAD(P)H-hydrate dehydratase, partial [Pseudomonadales bacterium]
EAALYAGAGLVSVATHSSNVGAILARRPELMPKPVARAKDMQTLLNQATALVIGPGLGADYRAKSLFKAALQANLPSVIDADGLNLLAENKEQHREQRDNWALTPHPGEATRLLGRSDIQADRLRAVKELQGTYGGASLLKGTGTLIATANQVSLNPYGNPGMAVAGTGDVLAGLIGALIAQGLPLDLACRLGATLHSKAADICVEATGERGLLAAELAPVIRQLINGKTNPSPNEPHK